MEVLSTYELVLLTQSTEKHVEFPCNYKSRVLLHVGQVNWDLVLELFESKKAEEAQYVVDCVQTSKRLLAHEVSYFNQSLRF